MHSAQTRRNGDQMTNTRYETADEGAHIAFLAEIFLCALDLLTRQQAHMAQTTVCELIDDEASEPNRQTIVDDRAYHRT